MKNLYFAISLFFITSIALAQAPELMSYQALVRNAQGELIQDTSVGIRISILLNSETGTPVYTETHTVSTNENGLVTLSIGAGATSDDFAAIEWGNGTYYVKSETDPNGGTNYTIEGTSQLLSVPYALHAKTTETAGSVSSSDLVGTVESDNGALGIMTTSSAYAFNSNGTGNQWWQTSLSGSPLDIAD